MKKILSQAAPWVGTGITVIVLLIGFTSSTARMEERVENNSKNIQDNSEKIDDIEVKLDKIIEDVGYIRGVIESQKNASN